jgi:hypothetical protein
MIVGLVSDVPETSTWVMLASGFGLMGAAALLRRTSAMIRSASSEPQRPAPRDSLSHRHCGVLESSSSSRLPFRCRDQNRRHKTRASDFAADNLRTAARRGQ